MTNEEKIGMIRDALEKSSSAFFGFTACGDDHSDEMCACDRAISILDSMKVDAVEEINEEYIIGKLSAAMVMSGQTCDEDTWSSILASECVRVLKRFKSGLKIIPDSEGGG